MVDRRRYDLNLASLNVVTHSEAAARGPNFVGGHLT